MPELKCTVQTCMHNQDFYCDLGEIRVGGSSARTPEETSCDSFEERKSGTYTTNAIHEGQPTSKIECQATGCKYNEKCQCHAGKISVEGSQACHCGDTECATFTCGC